MFFDVMCYICCMAVKTKKPETPTLATYGLEYDEPVRFRRSEGQTWDFGKARGIERDGSIGLRDEYSGASRAIYAHLIQKQIRGVRGGKKWIPIIEV